MTQDRQVTFTFLNGSSLSVKFPIQAGDDLVTSLSNLKKGLDSDRIKIEVDGDLMVIPVASLAHIRIHPAPKALPSGIILGAHVIGEVKNGG